MLSSNNSPNFHVLDALYPLLQICAVLAPYVEPVSGVFGDSGEGEGRARGKTRRKQWCMPLGRGFDATPIPRSRLVN